MLRKLITFIVLSIFYSVSYAYMAVYSCSNCDETINVPIGGSNFDAAILYLFFLPISLLLCLQLLWRLIKKQKIEDKHIFGFLSIIIISFAYFLQSHIETEYKSSFAGNYTYENKEINYVMNNNQLINQHTQHSARIIGAYIYNEDDNQYIFGKKDQFYLVDFNHHIVYKLTKKQTVH